MNEFFYVILSLHDQNGKLKFFDFVFAEGNVSISRCDVHVFGTGDFFAIFNKQIQGVERGDEIETDRLFFVNLELKNDLLLVIVHKVGKGLAVFEVNVLVISVDSGKGVLTVVENLDCDQ